MNLVMELILPFVERRSRNGLNVDIVQKIKLDLGERSEKPSLSIGFLTPFTPISKGQQHCELCKSEITGKGIKTGKDKLLKLRGQCQMCGITPCQRHQVQLCKNSH